MIIMSRADDERLLKMLTLADCEGLTGKQIGERFGVSQNSVLGQLHRVRCEDVPCACAKPENKDGGMPALWWTK